ncbi:uncharacterized protein TM35_002891000 [Trypanosoma theileri]|uniref:Uncharacterized protein n=1 Tax=Trypanosoma theileri TaxID=67003 RepID=A0A1X0ND68_9TRYP|nr:uncharacterized protein TM35_002891000 [Trypanosoma theileri]ORC76824.1 hypothetical protein TM35_002891000 [Trypanosoma theileri]
MKESVFLCLFALVTLLVSHHVYAQSSKSEHIITFNGTGWDSVVKDKSAELREALIADIGLQLNRRYAFNTTITFDSLSTSGNLQVELSVNQTVLPTVAEPWLQHIWTPEEVSSLIEQSKFATTLAMYPGPDVSSFVSVRIPGEGEELSECTGVCKGMVSMGIIIVGLMMVVFLVTLSYVCCCNRRRDKQSPREPHRDSIDWKR